MNGRRKDRVELRQELSSLPSTTSTVFVPGCRCDRQNHGMLVVVQVRHLVVLHAVQDASPVRPAAPEIRCDTRQSAAVERGARQLAVRLHREGLLSP